MISVFCQFSVVCAFSFYCVLMSFYFFLTYIFKESISLFIVICTSILCCCCKIADVKLRVLKAELYLYQSFTKPSRNSESSVQKALQLVSYSAQRRQSVIQSIFQLVRPSINLSVSPFVNKSVGLSVSHSACQPVCQQVGQSVCPVSRSVNQSVVLEQISQLDQTIQSVILSLSPLPSLPSPQPL